jgi:hypothetical protein
MSLEAEKMASTFIIYSALTAMPESMVSWKTWVSPFQPPKNFSLDSALISLYVAPSPKTTDQRTNA